MEGSTIEPKLTERDVITPDVFVRAITCSAENSEGCGRMKAMNISIERRKMKTAFQSRVQAKGPTEWKVNDKNEKIFEKNEHRP